MSECEATVGQTFGQYVELVREAFGHADRHGPLLAYLQGLLLPGRRKCVGPMAARVDPGRVSARHQSMHHLVAQSGWDDASVLRVVRRYVLPKMELHGSLAAWILDDTGIRKKGRSSVGVANQYCGELGKNDNCQVAVSLSVANGQASVPVGYRSICCQVAVSLSVANGQASVPVGYRSICPGVVGPKQAAAWGQREVVGVPVVSSGPPRGGGA